MSHQCLACRRFLSCRNKSTPVFFHSDEGLEYCLKNFYRDKLYRYRKTGRVWVKIKSVSEHTFPKYVREALVGIRFPVDSSQEIDGFFSIKFSHIALVLATKNPVALRVLRLTYPEGREPTHIHFQTKICRVVESGPKHKSKIFSLPIKGRSFFEKVLKYA